MRWARLHGHTSIKVYEDVRGSNAACDSNLLLALGACEQGDIFCVYSLSRLSRLEKDLQAVFRVLGSLKVDLVSLSENIDTTNASGKIFFSMMKALDASDRSSPTERISAAMQFRRAKNELVGAVPYGKQLAEDGVHLLDEPEEQAVISLAREIKNSGHSLRAVGWELATLGHLSRNGKVFTSGQIKRMLA